MCQKFCPSCGQLQASQLKSSAKQTHSGLVKQMQHTESPSELPHGWKAPSPRVSSTVSPRTSSSNDLRAAAAPEPDVTSDARSLKGTTETVVGQMTGANKPTGIGGAPCVKCEEPTGGAKFCLKCGQLQPGTAIGHLGGVTSPNAYK